MASSPTADRGDSDDLADSDDLGDDARGDSGARSGPDAGTGALAELSYEQARDELVAVVARLESGAVPLEESLVLWERGEALAARCQQWLDGARARLEAVRSQEPPPAHG